ncbi:MAG: M15 family metallopeptidase [Eudoraea sp.]|nr:M15 family metallopeptidase [Eudoraea sp.]
MLRRSFFTKIKLMAILVLTIQTAVWAQTAEYDISELMGKADIDLYGEGINLRKEAHDAFVEMKKAAYQDGISIEIVSSYRSFDRQLAIYERKYLQYTEDDGMDPLAAIDKIIEYSTIPGTSRHHWGTDIDIIDSSKNTEGDVLVASKFEEGGPFADLKVWMEEHASEYGFYLVYTNESKRRGFKYEPWHYSYAPLSVPMLEIFRRKNILQLLVEEDFIGSEFLTTGFIKTYIRDNILDINRVLL